MLQYVWNPFSKYVVRLERKIDKFLSRANYGNKYALERRLGKIMSTNMVVLNLWLEYKFKGYQYLKKRTRRAMYQNTQKIAEEFLKFTESNQIPKKSLLANLHSKGLSVKEPDLDKVQYLAKIMAFLKPGQHYQYLEGASFGKLLKDISKEMMIGDCNQITTFYVFLFALKFPLDDLQIKLPKGHVCLHFKGIDIEATNGTFQKYTEYQYILPITELISTNLLDVSDFRDKTIKIDPKEFIKGARLAYALSSHRELVSKNLQVAYNNIAVEALNKNDFKNAEFYFGKTKNHKALQSVYRNAALYYAEHKNFRSAKYYVNKSSSAEIKKFVQEKEAFYYFDKGSIDRARVMFAAIGNKQMVKACYGKEYNKIQARVSGITLLSEMRKHKSDYRKMLQLAKHMDDSRLVENLQGILRKI